METHDDYKTVDRVGLCDVCQDIKSWNPQKFPSQVRYRGDPRPHPQPNMFPHHRTSASFHAAVQNQCYICTNFNLLQRRLKLEKEEEVHLVKNCSKTCYYTTYKTVILLGQKGTCLVYIERASLTMPFVIYDSKGMTLLSSEEGHYRITGYLVYPSPVTLPLNTFGDENRATFRSWYNDCLTRHNCGSAAISISWTPTRLLDLGTSTSSEWKLCIPKLDRTLVPQYTTMSYRWGDGQFLKLTSRLMDSFRSGKLIKSLPRAFQDAISVTKDLGIRFLWIDALCIIQDDEDDFHNECAQMSNIYRYSNCNIVAACGRDPFTTMFQERCFDSLQIGQFKSVWNSDNSTHVDQYDFDQVVDMNYLWNDFLDCTVFTRGWIFQELHLPSRLLYFGKNQVHWVCLNQSVCDIWPNNEPPIPPGQASHKLVDSLKYTKVELSTQIWYSLVESYSRLSFTVAEDRLLALSGLANTFFDRTQDEYFAGHWEMGFERSLSWYRGNRYRPICRDRIESHIQVPQRSSHIAPSWSWASVDASVSFDLSSAALFCVNIQDIYLEVKATNSHPFGRVTSGALLLLALSKTTTVSPDLKLQIPQFETESIQTELWWDFPEYANLYAGKEVILIVTGTELQDLSRSKGPKIVFKPELIVHSLVLKVDENDPRRYKRIGAYFVRCFSKEERISLNSDLGVHFFGSGFENERLAFNVLLREFGLEIVNDETHGVCPIDRAKLRYFMII
jgi:Heterokaryon incompatibility protein (HET)